MKLVILACALAAACLSLAVAPAHAWSGAELVEVDAYEEADLADLRQEPCPTGCHNHGLCTQDGQCMCYDGWGGKDCATPVCPATCGVHGACVDGKCVCKPGWTGYDCSYRGCQDDCSGHGVCHITPYSSECTCYKGYSGAICEIADAATLATKCKDDCNGRGACVGDKCQCQLGWVGKSCEQPECLHGCHGRGICDIATGTCQCLDTAKFSGKYCETQNCPNGCSGNGVCTENGVCKCNAGFFGRDCAAENCPDNCHFPEQGECIVQDARPVDPYDPTSKLGDRRGVCKCSAFFAGANCGKRRCALDCSGKGVCDETTHTCKCRDGWAGEACNLKPCPQECVHGACVDGACACEPDWEGDTCAIQKVCKHDCSGNGVCRNGNCYCKTGFEGDDCARAVGAALAPTPLLSKDGAQVPAGQRVCSPACVLGKGVCVVSPASGLPVCTCKDGFGGADCGELLVYDLTKKTASFLSTANDTVTVKPAETPAAAAPAAGNVTANATAPAGNTTAANVSAPAAANATAGAGNATVAANITAAAGNTTAAAGNATVTSAANGTAAAGNASATTNATAAGINATVVAPNATVVAANATAGNGTAAAHNYTGLGVVAANNTIPASANKVCQPACGAHGRCLVLDAAAGPQCYCQRGFTGPTCTIALPKPAPAAAKKDEKKKDDKKEAKKPAAPAAAKKDAATERAEKKAKGAIEKAAADKAKAAQAAKAEQLKAKASALANAASAAKKIAEATKAAAGSAKGGKKDAAAAGKKDDKKAAPAAAAAAAGGKKDGKDVADKKGGKKEATPTSLVEEASYYDEDALWEYEQDQHEDEMLLRALDTIIAE